jgi:tyrosinase
MSWCGAEGRSRTRKSFLQLSTGDRAKFISAWRKLATGDDVASSLTAQFHALIALHQDKYNDGIFTAAAWLPWHRWFLVEMENLLQQVDCSVTIPYWAWEDEPYGLGWDSELWSSSASGIGAGSDGECVAEGVFSESGGFVLPPATQPYVGKCLRRDRAGLLPSRAQVNRVLAIEPSNFDAFYTGITELHGIVHCAVGGTMCSTFQTTGGALGFAAASTPEFLLHHANTDRLWALWQEKTAAHFVAYNADVDTKLPFIGFDGYLGPAALTPRALLNSHSMHGGLSVVYSEYDASTLQVLNAWSSRSSLTEEVPPLAPTVIHEVPTPDCPEEQLYETLATWHTAQGLDEAQSTAQTKVIRDLLCPDNRIPVLAAREASDAFQCIGRVKRGKRASDKVCVGSNTI